jgi:hypothetical protein
MLPFDIYLKGKRFPSAFKCGRVAGRNVSLNLEVCFCFCNPNQCPVPTVTQGIPLRTKDHLSHNFASKTSVNYLEHSTPERA